MTEDTWINRLICHASLAALCILCFSYRPVNLQQTTSAGVTSDDVNITSSNSSEQQSIVGILIELQKQVELNNGITHSKEEERQVDAILEGDIMLTVDQAEALLDDSTAKRRRKRKLAEPSSKRWSLPIPYMFDGSHNSVERKRIKEALAYWQDLTCITFKENSSAAFKLLFVRQRGCWSYVGFTRQQNQTISIGEGCQSNGTIAHEVGHAVGFWHEQSRPDRDEHVTIHEDNITDGKLYNFQTRSWSEVVTFSIPYDLGSGMHYGAKFYAKDVNGTLTTMQTIDPLMMRVIGQRQELSFYDVKLANKAYCDNDSKMYMYVSAPAAESTTYYYSLEDLDFSVKLARIAPSPSQTIIARRTVSDACRACRPVCDDVIEYIIRDIRGCWLLDVCISYGIRLARPCRRDGYQDPKNCWRCRCPDGFGGTYCENVQLGVNDYCGGVLDARINGTIFSPGYPSPGYRPDVQCSWLIKAPEHTHVYLEFDGNFGITGHVDVCRDFVEVRYNTSLAVTGARFCCADPPRKPLRSDSNEMMVLFRSYSESLVCDDSKFPAKCKQYNIGFKARFYTKTCGGCRSSTGSGVFSACLKRASTICYQVWLEKAKIDCPRWWHADSCGTRTKQMQRRVQCFKDEPFCCDPYQLHDNLCVGNAISDLSNAVDRNGPQSGKYVKSTVTTSTTTSTTTTTRPRPPVQPVADANAWTGWSEWGQCSRVCGGGTAVRTRKCLVGGTCGSSNIQADKRPCSQQACFDKCPVKKQILCDLWTTCTKTVLEKCHARCSDGFTLYDNRCVQTGVT